MPEQQLRNKLNGLLYLLKTGCQWRMIPKEYGSWKKIYAQFRRWRDSEVLEKALSAINKKVRISQGREETPSLIIIDTQSVKTVQKGGPEVMTETKKSRAESVV